MPRSSLPVIKRSTAGMVPVGGFGCGRARGLLGQAHHLGLDAGILNQAAVRVAHAAGIGPACPEDAVLEGDGIDIHVFGPAVPRELLENLRNAEKDIAAAIHDACAAELTSVHRPLPVSAPWPQFVDPDAATRRPKIVPDSSGDCPSTVIGEPPWNGIDGTNL